MKTLSLLLTLALSVTSPALATPPQVQIVQTQPIPAESNRDLVEWTRASFEEGEYASFLKDMDREYQNGLENQEVDGLIEFLKQTGHFSKQIDPAAVNAQSEKNQKLLALVEKEESTSFVEKVRSSASSLKPEVAEAFQTIATLEMKEPGTGSNADENKVIDIRIEYLFKTMHLGSQQMNEDELRAKKQQQIALQMEGFNKLLEASKSFQDEALKKKVELAHQHLDEFLIKQRDTIDLAPFYQGIHTPQNSLEKNVMVILQESHEEQQDSE